MWIYLDNCCYNRPFDDQSQLRVRLEAEAKLKKLSDIQDIQVADPISFIREVLL